MAGREVLGQPDRRLVVFLAILVVLGQPGRDLAAERQREQGEHDEGEAVLVQPATHRRTSWARRVWAGRLQRGVVRRGQRRARPTAAAPSASMPGSLTLSLDAFATAARS